MIICFAVFGFTCHVGDGGAYPECHVAQYPLEMGKKKVRMYMPKLYIFPHILVGILR